MVRVGLLRNVTPELQLQDVDTPVVAIALSVQSNVIELFSENYKYARKYFNMVVTNFIEFGDVEETFIISLYKDLGDCSIYNIKHFLRDINSFQINDIEFNKFLIDLKNYCHFRINQLKQGLI